ncbi:MAG: IS200/IS605 family transposase [Bacteroidaceae bacterium]|nr:IS200/IS605 family transposase [Bacteroidaceae bacterium]
MSHSFVCLTVHLVFHIKSTAPCFRQEDLETVWKYIAGTIHRLGANALQVGGVSDHVHILCTLPRDISVASFVEKIKGGSSRWIKTLSPYYLLFYWQGGYGMFSVSSQNCNAVRNYILHQAEHHHKVSFREEYLSFLHAQGITPDEHWRIFE